MKGDIAVEAALPPFTLPTRVRYALWYWNFILGALLSMPVLPTKLILMDDLKVEPATMAAVLSWTTVPWSIKPLYGYISDSYPVFGYHRSPYIVMGLLANAASWFLLGAASQGHFGFTAVTNILFIASVSLVIAQVGVDTLVVENTKHEVGPEMGTLQSGAWMASSAGSCAAAIFSGIALDYPEVMTARTILFICGIAAFTGLFSLFFIKEQRYKVMASEGRDGFARSVSQIAEFWRRPEIWRTTLFLALFASSPTAADAVFYFYRNRLNLSMAFLGSLDVVGYAASAFAAWWFQRSLRFLRYSRLLRWTVFGAVGLGCCTLVVVLQWNRAAHIPDHAFVFGDTLALSICQHLAWMPITVIAARVAPDGAEGTAYQTVMSVWNLCEIFAQFLGGWAIYLLGVTSDNFSRLWLLVLICNLSTLLPLPLLSRLVPSACDLYNRDTPKLPVVVVDNWDPDAPPGAIGMREQHALDLPAGAAANDKVTSVDQLTHEKEN